MQKQKSIKVNFFMNALLTMSSVVFPLITSSHVARVLGPNGTGIVDFVYPMVMYFSMIAQLGIPTYGIRICAKVRDDKVELSRVVQELLIINMITCALAYICFFANYQAANFFCDTGIKIPAVRYGIQCRRPVMLQRCRKHQSSLSI